MRLPQIPNEKGLILNEPGRYFLRVCASTLKHAFEEEGPGYGGYVVPALIALAESVKFSYNLTKTPDNQWGVNNNGTWTGMIGMIHRNECDLGVGPMAMTFERSKVIDYTSYLIINYVTLLAGKSNKYTPNLFEGIMTFEWQVWMGILLTIIIIACFSVGVVAVLDPTKRTWDAVSSGLSRNFCILVASLFCEGYPNKSKSLTNRILISSWWLMAIVLMNGFSGNLKAKLMVQRQPDKIDSIQDILSDPSLIPLVHEGTAYEDYIRYSPNNELQQLWAQVQQHNGVKNTSILYGAEWLEKVYQGEAVIVSDLLTTKSIVSSVCRQMTGGMFYFGKQSIFPHNFAMALRKDLPAQVTKELRKSTRQISESGLFEKWVDIQNKDWTQCTSSSSGPEGSSLGMAEMSGIFVLWSLGLSLSLIIFLGEIAHSKWKK